MSTRNGRWKWVVLVALWLPCTVWATRVGVLVPSAGVVWIRSRSTTAPGPAWRIPESHYRTWARIAAMEAGVPVGILWRIVRVESGGWPWTLDIDGRPERFSNRAAMLGAARAAVSHGVRYLDIGIAQIDWRWNGARFGWSLGRAVNPVENLRVAARLLAKMRRTSGSWLRAIEDYHGGTDWERVNYAQRVVLGDE